MAQPCRGRLFWHGIFIGRGGSFWRGRYGRTTLDRTGFVPAPTFRVDEDHAGDDASCVLRLVTRQEDLASALGASSPAVDHRAHFSGSKAA